MFGSSCCLINCSLIDFFNYVFLFLTHLEDLLVKDTTDKSESAGEALLAQISLYAEKNLKKARDQVR